MPSLGFPELIIILIIALVLFGPGKLPQVGNAMGKAINEFKKASKEITKDDTKTDASSDSNKETKN